VEVDEVGLISGRHRLTRDQVKPRQGQEHHEEKREHLRTHHLKEKKKGRVKVRGFGGRLVRVRVLEI